MTIAETPAVQRIVLFPHAAKTISQVVATTHDGRETGGILLGALGPDGTAHVRHAGDPGPAAVRTPVYFLRDRAHAQQLADTAFERDGSIWIGEWHTHPATEPVPSTRDIETYQMLLADPELEFSVIIAIILGRLPLAPTPGLSMMAWACTADNISTAPADVSQAVAAKGHLRT